MDTYSILDIIGEAILSRGGQLSVVYRMEEPDCYSLSREDLELRNALYAQAIGNLPDGSWFHKQDVFLRRTFEPTDSSGRDLYPQGFIGEAEREHFNGREYLCHECYICLGITGLKSLESSYVTNPFSYKEHLHRADIERIEDFLSGVTACLTVLGSIDRQTTLRAVTGEELKRYILDYANFFQPQTAVLEPTYREEITAGDVIARYLAVCDDTFLPSDGILSTYVDDYTLPGNGNRLYMPMFEPLGIHLHCNHIYNQIIWLEGDQKLRQDLDRRRILFGANRKFDPEVERRACELEQLEERIMKDRSLLCECHFNLMLFDADERRLDIALKQAREVFARRNFRYLSPDGGTHCMLHMASTLGQESGLAKVANDPHRFTLLHSLPSALTYFIHYSTFRNDDEGILVNDRIFQVPLRLDIWDARRRYMDARNSMVIASTGAGKSATAQNIIQQLIEQGYTVVIIEFGNSFRQLCQLYPRESLHISYNGREPLGINPFDLEGQELDNEKIESLSAIIQRFWRHILNKPEDAEKKASLDTIIADYYGQHPGKEHSFINFYNHVKNHFVEIADRQSDQDLRRYFDLASFMQICSEFLPGKRYENVVKTVNMERLSGKRLIVFELSEIKNNQFLSSLVMSILFDVINTKILSDRSKRGYLVFDEYAEAAKMTDKAANTSIHSTVAYCYQTIRKQNGAVMTIIQTPSQLPHGNEPGASDTDNIIANTQLLLVLPTTEVVYDDVISLFRIKNEAHIAQMKSIQNRFTGEKPYSELYVRMQEKRSIVVRQELSHRKFLCFQTDGEVTSAIDYIDSYAKDREKAIRIYEDFEKRITELIAMSGFEKGLQEFCSSPEFMARLNQT